MLFGKSSEGAKEKWEGWRVGVVLGYLAIWALILIFKGRLPPKFPLFYSLPYGEEQLGDRFDVYRIMGGMGLLVGISELGGWWLARRGYGFLGKVVWVGIAWVELLWVITLVKVWALVGW